MSKILMCHPSHYGISYEINPWMRVQNQADNTLARRQWQRLIQLIHNLGASIEEMSGEPNLPDIVFTANAGLVAGNKVVLSNFKYPERQGEKLVFRKWFLDHGYEVLELPEHLSFEGAGDALPARNMLYCGYGFRSDQEAYMQQAFFRLGFAGMTFCKLVDPYFYHIDTCFCPLKDDHAIIFPGAFDEMSLEAMGEKLQLIPIPEAEARKFACNAVVVENNVIIPSGCPTTRSLLENIGFQVFDTDMSEFIKAGGACKCLTLRI